MSDLIKKTNVVPFINSGTALQPTWTQIKKSTSFTLAMNPQTKTFDFISSENPENEIESYQPNLTQSITMFADEPDYKIIFDMLFKRATGKEAHRDALVVFYKEPAEYTPEGESTAVTVFKSWKIDALVSLNQMDTVNNSIDFDLGFNSIEEGAVIIGVDGSPTFTKGTFKNGVFTPAA